MATQADYLKLHFIVFLWGFSAILGKLVSIPPVEMVLFRALFAAAGLAMVIMARRESFSVTTEQFFQLLGIGVIVAIHWVSFFGSARVSNVSVSLVGFATNSLWAALLEPWFNGKKIKRFELILGIVVLTGLYVIFSIRFDYYMGLALGILAGFTSALFSVYNSRMVRKLPSFTITFYEMIGIFISLSLFLPLYKVWFAEGGELKLMPTWEDLIYIGLLAGVCSVYAYSVAVELMKKISVFMIQLTLNLEPIYGIAMAVIVFGQQEKMGLNFYLGTLIILSAVLCYPYFRRRYEARIPTK